MDRKQKFPHSSPTSPNMKKRIVQHGSAWIETGIVHIVNWCKEDEDTDKIRIGVFTLARLAKGSSEEK